MFRLWNLPLFLICITRLFDSHSTGQERELRPGQVDAVSRSFLGPLQGDFLRPNEIGLEFEESTIKKVRCPILIMHGEKDRLLPPMDSIALANAASAPVRLWIMEGAGHAPETLEIYDGEYAVQLREFFRSAFDRSFEQPPVKLRSRKNGDGWLAEIAVESNDSTNWQIAIGSSDGRFHFVRSRGSSGTMVQAKVPFEPTHASAIAMHQVETNSDGTWSRSRTDLSKSLAQYREFAAELERNCPWQRLVVVSGVLRSVNYRSTEYIPWILKNLPNAASIHPGVRPRYARLLAVYFAALPPHDQAKALELVESSIPFLPDEPEKYFQLENASFELRLRDERLAGALILLAKRRFEDRDLSAAQTLLVKATRMSVQSWLNQPKIESLTLDGDFFAQIGFPTTGLQSFRIGQ